MRQLAISTGRSRQDMRWKQKSVTWERLLEKLSKTHYTAETEAEYKIASKDRKTEIKDIGGFVGGPVEGGKRKKGAVKIRSLITLDIDYGRAGVWDDICLEYGCALAIYSTHSHTKSSPRLRLIIPLSRDVDREEYEALSRAVANNIGIDMFDDSTYQPERLMFWPSTPKDGEFIFEQQAGEPLDVDQELKANYRDWHDSSQWPVSSRVKEIVRRSVDHQADPTTKPGIVGRFCRAYDIHEAIETFLGEIYEPTDADPTRYTYLLGSTAGGLVTYDDKFAYSHHGTDPAGGQLCNSFDLVRIHLYGEKDARSSSDDPTKLPSYKAMGELVEQDPKVRAGDMAELDEEFGDVEPDDPEPEGRKKKKEKQDNSWQMQLDVDKQGKPRSTTDNILLILNNRKGLKANILYNDLARLIVMREDLPWRSIRESEGGIYWNNDDDAALQVFMETHYLITGKEKILNAQAFVARQNHFHPVRDYLHSLSWDNTPRLETIFIDYLGAEDTPLTRAVTRKCMVAAIARVMKPGCKYDYITVLQGPESIGKSTLLGKLGGEWFNDSVNDLGGDKGMEQIQGCWIIETPELQGVKRNEVEAVKAFVSRQIDTYRPAYGRKKETMPRQCVFFSTTNELEFLRGNTGNRRFWVIPCFGPRSKDSWDMEEPERGQIWAEALTYYNKGEDLFLPQDLEASMRQRQSDLNELSSDPRCGMIMSYLEKPLPVDWSARDINSRLVYLADDDQQSEQGVNKRQYVCVAEILRECLGEKIDERSRYKSNDIAAMMAKIPGWEKCDRVHKFSLYGPQRAYKRISNE